MEAYVLMSLRSQNTSLFIGSSEYRPIRLSACTLADFLGTGQLLFHVIINLGARAISTPLRLIMVPPTANYIMCRLWKLLYGDVSLPSVRVSVQLWQCRTICQ